MSEEKKYILKKHGDGKSPHILVNAENEKDILELCSCGHSKDENMFCDDSHKSVADGTCCGGTGIHHKKEDVCEGDCCKDDNESEGCCKDGKCSC